MASRCMDALSLAANGVTARGAKDAAASLSDCHALQSLDLSGNELGDEGAAAVCVGLLGSRSLERVGLNGCSLGAKAGRQILKTVETLSNSLRVGRSASALTAISVARNPSMDAGNLAAIAAATAHLASLRAAAERAQADGVKAVPEQSA